MKKISRRSFLQAAGATTLAGALAACSSTDTATDSATTSTGTTSTASTADASADPVTLKVAVWDITSYPYYTALVDTYMEKNPNVTIEVIDIPSADYTTKMAVMLNASSDVDVFWVKDSADAVDYYEKGQLLDLTPYVESSGLNADDYHGLVENFIFDGKNYAIPAQSQYYMLYFDKDLFDAAGVEYPTNDMTWDEFEDLAYRMTSGSGNDKVYGAYFHTWYGCYLNWALQSGEYDIMSTNYADFYTPYLERALRLQDDGIVKDYATASTSSLHYSTEFYAGNTAMVPIGNWFTAMILEKQNNGEYSRNWDFVMIPHPDDVEAGYSVGSITAVAASANSANPDTAWDFINHVVGPDGAEIYANAGVIPAASTDEHYAVMAAVDGMPADQEATIAAMTVKNIEFDRPVKALVSEVNDAITEEYELIMLGESTIEEGLANMTERSKEIQGL